VVLIFIKLKVKFLFKYLRVTSLFYSFLKITFFKNKQISYCHKTKRSKLTTVEKNKRKIAKIIKAVWFDWYFT